MRALAAVVGVCALVLSTCTELTTETIDDGSGKLPDSPSFAYYLPRELYQITVTYQLTACPDLAKSTPPTVVQSNVTVVPIDVADPKEHYYITYTTLDSWWKNTTFQANLWNNQTLKSYGVVSASQVAQTASNLMVAGLNAAKAAATPYKVPPPAAHCKPEIEAAVAAAKSVSSFMSAYPPQATVSGTNRSDYSTIASTNQAATTMQVIVIWNPTKVGDSSLFTFMPTKTQLAKWFVGDVSALLTQIPATAQQLETSVVLGFVTYIPQTTKPVSSPNKPIEGIVYRDPAPTILKVCQGTKCSAPDPTAPTLSDSTSDEVMLLTQQISVPQAGNYVVMPLKNGWFDNDNIGLSFAANGVPCAVAYGTQSQLYQIAQGLNTASASSSPSQQSSSSNASSSSTTGASSSQGGKGQGQGQGQGNNAQNGNSNSGSSGSPSLAPSC